MHGAWLFIMMGLGLPEWEANGVERRTEIRIYVDADGCPVKNEVYKVARRYGLRVFVVANQRMGTPNMDFIECVVVDEGFDAADDWIAERVTVTDIVVTSDIPLAARCIEKGARVLNPKGHIFTEANIGDAVANRELASFLREMGEMGGGPPPFQARDRSEFLGRLDQLIQAVKKAQRLAEEP